jgi:hypothetical protein
MRSAIYWVHASTVLPRTNNSLQPRRPLDHLHMPTRIIRDLAGKRLYLTAADRDG